jgi:hypothetical protein
MLSLRHSLPVLAALLSASLASEAQAGPRPRPAPVAQPAPDRGAEAEPAPPGARRRSKTPPAEPAAEPATASATRPERGAGTKSAPVSKDSPAAAEVSRPRPTARPLRPKREPLLARHPAASCALDPLEAIALHQHGRARDSLREFYWSDMARFFETSVDGAEPVPEQVIDPAFMSTDAVLREIPAAVRKPLAAVAAARVVDRLGEREFARVSKLLASLAPAQVAGLLRADSPTLRAYVWTWLATTRTGGCHLGHLDLDFIESAVGDRSVAVEHGDDLVYRSLGDYALAARARLATLDPARFDRFLERLTTATEVDPLVRAAAHGVLLRRARWDLQDRGLRDPSPPVRAATAAGAIEMNRDKVEPTLVEHAASDPADLVTELIVGALLGVYDPHSHGRPQLRGPLASTRDERLAAAVARWRGRGDPLEPLPLPRRPLRFDASPVLKDMPARTAVAAQLRDDAAALEHTPARTADAEPVPETSRPAPATRTRPDPAPLARNPQAEPSTRPRADAPRLPGVLDDPDDFAPPARP